MMKGSTLMMTFVLLTAVILAAQGTAQHIGDQTEDIGLHVTEIRFSDDSPNEGSTITISAVLRNDAPVPMENVTLLWQMDGAEMDQVRGIALAANTSQTFELKWETKGGTHNFSTIVLVNINGTPVTVSMLSREITVSIGDVLTPLLALFVIAASVFLVALFPSIWKSIKRNGMPVKPPARRARTATVRNKR